MPQGRPSLKTGVLLNGRYTSVAALETLGKAYREATELMEDYYVAFHQETQLAAEGRSPCPELQGLAVLEKNALIERVAQPLSALPCLLYYMVTCASPSMNKEGKRQQHSSMSRNVISQVEACGKCLQVSPRL